VLEFWARVGKKNLLACVGYCWLRGMCTGENFVVPGACYGDQANVQWEHERERA
jgi:hypothetical protein